MSSASAMKSADSAPLLGTNMEPSKSNTGTTYLHWPGKAPEKGHGRN